MVANFIGEKRDFFALVHSITLWTQICQKEEKNVKTLFGTLEYVFSILLFGTLKYVFSIFISGTLKYVFLIFFCFGTLDYVLLDRWNIIIAVLSIIIIFVSNGILQSMLTV